jgi:hypothetical protein|tara:strand:- start:19 stop:330 length:312 start_codon:yes stop_codon:yes gene_type:complete
MSGLDNTLYLIVYKDIFERIMSNEKVVEYRECTKYWNKRLEDKSYSKLRITNGYGNDTRPYVLLRYLGYDIVERDGKPHYAIPIQRALWKEYRQEVNGEIINE